MRKICFVCTGNTCRSPMAEKLMKKHLEKLGIQDVEVSSLGTSVIDGEKLCDFANNALKAYGIRKSARKAKQLRPNDLKKDILFITMTNEQKKFFGQNKNVFSLGELVGGDDVMDPYGFGQDVYNQTAKMLNDYTYKLAQNLKQ
ncbi:MAG: hypothetical protein ACI4T2_02395 [Christensenellales bacterium]